MTDKVAIVTGANKGIGFAIVKGLCERFDGVVYLTSRDEVRGKKATADLEKLGLRPQYHQLDVADKSSVERFRDHIKERHNGIDILINNAAVAGLELIKSYEESKNIIDINYRGVLTVEQFLFPLLNDNARVLNISSDCGHLSNIKNKEWIDRLSKKNLTRADIEDFVNWFLESIKKGTFRKSDFADRGSVAAYRVSKVAVSALTMIQQKDLDSRGISVNSMHPGLVSTDMSMNVGFYSIHEAAKTPLYLVLDAPKTLKGAYVWYDGKVLDWYDYKADYYFKSLSIAKQYLKNLFGFSKDLNWAAHLLVAGLSVGMIVAITRVFGQH